MPRAGELQALPRVDQAALVTHQWTMKPFQGASKLEVPVFDLVSGQPTEQVVELDHSIYNLPLRRDILHTCYRYFEFKDRYITKRVKTVGTVAGSGIKPVMQKGRGASRQGNKRAPQRAGGGAAHGPVPRALGFPINNKLKLLGLKTMLSAKLFEEKLAVIETEKLAYPKTQYLEAILKSYGNLDKLLFLVPDDVDANFKLAARNLSNVTIRNAQEFNIPELLRHDLVFMTIEGLHQLEETIAKREGNYYRNKKVSRPEVIEKRMAKRKDPFVRDIIEPIVHGEAEDLDQVFGAYDENLPVHLQVPSLRTYIDDLRKMQQEASGESIPEESATQQESV